MKTISAKEIAMIADGDWNQMSEEHNQIVALINLVEQKDKHTKTKSDKDPPGNNKEPGWKTLAPAGDEPTTKTVKGKQFHWCIHCNKGNGMWVFHISKQHKNDFVRPPKDNKKGTKDQ